MGQCCREAGMGPGRCLEKRGVAIVARSFRDVDFNTVDSGFQDVEGEQDGWDTILSQSVESSHDHIEWWFFLDMSEFGSLPNAKRVNGLGAQGAEWP